MRQTVIAEVIAERSFGKQLVGNDRAGDAKIGFGVDGKSSAAADHGDAMSAKRSGKPNSDMPSGSGITAATDMRERPRRRC